MAEAGHELLIRAARRLAWVSLAYNVLEALASLAFGIKDGSLSLFGFGGDSVIEAASAAVILWRFQSAVEGANDPRERAAQKLIGVLLIALAVFLAISALFELKSGKGPSEGLPGLVIAAVSLLVMFWLYRAKMKVANALESAALKADAFCTLSCMWLSGLLLLGSAMLAGTHLAGFDAATTLGMAWLIGREGLEEYDEASAEGGD